MIRWILFYALVIYYRAIRWLIRPEITGDTNFLSSPVMTIRWLLRDPILLNAQTFVDIGCGEGIVGMYVCLVQKKQVVLHDTQDHFLRMIRGFSTMLFVKNMDVSKHYLSQYPSRSIFFCVWTSWSVKNRRQLLSKMDALVPKGAYVLTVSHGIVHPAFVECKRVSARFAWGPATVYYYKHA